MRIEVVTLFPEFVAQAVRVGVLGRAIEAGRVAVQATTPREFATDVHRTVDDRPYGGGPGMVLKVEPVRTAIACREGATAGGEPRIYLAADGEPLTQALARELAQLPGLMLLAGRYEGVDERLIESRDRRERVDRRLRAVGRRVAGAGGDRCGGAIAAGRAGRRRSAVQESFATGLLDWPHYTRPEVFEGRAVPEVLRRQPRRDPALAARSRRSGARGCAGRI